MVIWELLGLLTASFLHELLEVDSRSRSTRIHTDLDLGQDLTFDTEKTGELKLSVRPSLPCLLLATAHSTRLWVLANCLLLASFFFA